MIKYSNEFKEKVFQHIAEGHSLWKTAVRFKISISTINRWRRVAGLVDPKMLAINGRKLDTAEFVKYVQEHPFATIAEMAKGLNCSVGTIALELQSNGFSREGKTGTSAAMVPWRRKEPDK